jgi:hypothetical protein
LRIRHHFVFPNQVSGDLSDESNNLKNYECIKLKFDLRHVKYIIVSSPEEKPEISNMITGSGDIEVKTVSEVLKTGSPDFVRHKK